MAFKWLTVIFMVILTLGTGAGVVYEAGKRSVVTTKTSLGSGINKVVKVSNPNGINENRCIVTVNGNSYDVTSLAQTHGGPRGSSITDGGFFKCGTDMTQEYVQKHGNNLNRMAPYLITGTNATSQTTVTTGNTNMRDENNDDEWDD
ncbi:MAG: hypothetical protein WCT01_02140 [Candidatus Shapirobacteria bacterium]